MEIKIGNKFIGDKHSCFIIAEAGVNHDGDLKKAKKLIDIAKDAGADCIKFQTWITEEIITKDTKQAEYQEKNTGRKESQYEMIKKLELSFEQFAELKNYSDKKKILFLSTPDDERSVDFLDDLGVEAFKIGSGEITNLSILKRIAKKGKPIIMSTGMSIIAEIQEAVQTIYKTGNNKLALLHCTSQYPAKFEDVNLNAMITLKNIFETIIGYSDHTEGTIVPQIAVSMGAKIIEKHFTYDKNAIGPDHRCSLSPNELKEMISEIRKVELIMGESDKKPTNEENELKKLVRKTVVAKLDIPKGELITKNMLTLKRSPGNLEPKELYRVIGKISQRAIKKDDPIRLNDIK